MSFLFESDPRQHSRAIALVRIVVGIVFLVHGWQKVFQMGFAGVTGGFAQMGVPAPEVIAPLVTVIELLGGAALIVGLVTRLAALGLAADMAGAILIVHFKNGFFSPMGYEYPLTLLVASIAVVVAGPGAWAIDNSLASRNRGPSSQ